MNRASAFLPGLVFLAWASALLWLLETGRYRLFLHPGFRVLLLAGVLLALVFFLAAAFAPARRASATRAAVAAAVLLMPLLHAARAGGPLRAQAFRKRAVAPARIVVRTDGAGVERMAFAGIPLPSTRGGRASPRDDTATLLDILRDFETLRDARIVTDGMVCRDDSLPDGGFLLFRFVVVCCAADALALAVVVAPPDGCAPAADAWVRVRGRLEVSSIGGKLYACIRADSVDPIGAPRNPYLTE